MTADHRTRVAWLHGEGVRLHSAFDEMRGAARIACILHSNRQVLPSLPVHIDCSQPHHQLPFQGRRFLTHSDASNFDIGMKTGSRYLQPSQGRRTAGAERRSSSGALGRKRCSNAQSHRVPPCA